MNDEVTREEYLEHAGVKGMRWGIRKKYYTTKAKYSIKKANKAIKKANEAGANVAIKPKKIKSGEPTQKVRTTDLKGKKIDYDTNPALGGNNRRMSNKELEARVKRLKLEKEYLENLPKQPEVKTKIDRLMETTKKYTDYAKQANDTYNTINNSLKIVNDVLGTKKK